MQTSSETRHGVGDESPLAPGERSPGWFPDERRPSRFRHWDGRDWNAMTSTTPVWGEEGLPRRAGAARSGSSVRTALAAAAAMVLVVGIGVVLQSSRSNDVVADGNDDPVEVLAKTLERGDQDGAAQGGGSGSAGGAGGSDDPASGQGSGGSGTSGGSNGTSTANGGGGGGVGSGSPSNGSSLGDNAAGGGSADAGGGSSSGSGAGAGGSAGGSAPGTGTSGAPGAGTGAGAGAGQPGQGSSPIGNPTLDTNDGGGPPETMGCDAFIPELQGVLRSFPGLQAVSATMTISEIQCNGRWASGTTSSLVTPDSLAVFERQNDQWVLVAYGLNNPCSQLGLSFELAQNLRCT